MKSSHSNIVDLGEYLQMPKDVVDELFEKIGSIGAKVDIVHEKQVVIDDKLSHMGERDVRVEAAVKSAHKRLDALEPKVDQHRKDYDADKNKRIGFIAAVSMLFSFLAWLISQALGYFIK